MLKLTKTFWRYKLPLFAAFFVLPLSLVAQSRYVVMELLRGEAVSSNANAINNLGQVTGSIAFANTTPTPQHAYRTRAHLDFESAEDLGTLDGPNSVGNAIETEIAITLATHVSLLS